MQEQTAGGVQFLLKPSARNPVRQGVAAALQQPRGAGFSQSLLQASSQLDAAAGKGAASEKPAAPASAAITSAEPIRSTGTNLDAVDDVSTTVESMAVKSEADPSESPELATESALLGESTARTAVAAPGTTAGLATAPANTTNSSTTAGNTAVPANVTDSSSTTGNTTGIKSDSVVGTLPGAGVSQPSMTQTTNPDQMTSGSIAPGGIKPALPEGAVGTEASNPAVQTGKLSPPASPRQPIPATIVTPGQRGAAQAAGPQIAETQASRIHTATQAPGVVSTAGGSQASVTNVAVDPAAIQGRSDPANLAEGRGTTVAAGMASVTAAGSSTPTPTPTPTSETTAARVPAEVATAAVPATETAGTGRQQTPAVSMSGQVARPTSEQSTAPLAAAGPPVTTAGQIAQTATTAGADATRVIHGAPRLITNAGSGAKGVGSPDGVSVEPSRTEEDVEQLVEVAAGEELEQATEQRLREQRRDTAWDATRQSAKLTDKASAEFLTGSAARAVDNAGVAAGDTLMTSTRGQLLPATGPLAAMGLSPSGAEGAAPSSSTAPFSVPLLGAQPQQALAENVRWMVNRNLGSAEINLAPAGMGPVSVKLDLDKERMHVSIIAPHGVTRDALESLLPRLREQLQSQGHSQVDVSVSERREAPADSRQQGGQHMNQQANSQANGQSGGQTGGQTGQGNGENRGSSAERDRQAAQAGPVLAEENAIGIQQGVLSNNRPGGASRYDLYV